MIEETIRAVKSAEAQADQILADAKERADQIVKDAQAQAARSDTHSKEAAQESRKKQLGAARSEADAYLLDQEKRAQKEADEIRAEASAKEGAAIDSVIRILLS